MAVTEAALDGFRGGLAARRAPLDFGDEQWSKLHGFVLEDGGTLRSQWPLQEISGISDVSAMSTYQGFGETPFLVVVKADGTVHWREAPPDDAETVAAELSSDWHPLLDEAGAPVTGVTGIRPLFTVPLDAAVLSHADGGLRPALMLNTINLSDTGKVLFVYESDDPATEAQRLRSMNLGSSALWPVNSDTNTSPKGEHGCLWSGVVVLGDIEWKADPNSALSSSNKTRYRNGLWLSVPGEALRFDPLSVLFIGDPNTHISGIQPTDQGLLVFTNSLEGIGGVHILRGTPDAYTLEPLHVGIGVQEAQTFWQDTNTYCWVTAAGEVWQTDTQALRRLDRQGLGVDRQKSPRDGAKSFGPWLLVVRENRMFVLRALDDGRTAAWTEANIDSLAGPPDARFAQESGQSIYFLADGLIYRFTRADIRTGVSERGSTPTGQPDLSIGTRTLSTGKGHRKTYWHRVGVRASAGYRATGATCERVILRAGPVLDDRAPFVARHGPFALEGTADEDVSDPDVETPVVEFTETWTAANSSAGIDADNDWTALGSADFDLVSNRAQSAGSGTGFYFLNDALSNDSQYAKVDVVDAAAHHYLFVRNPGTGTQTHYRFVQTGTGASARRAIERVVDGSATTLTAAAAGVDGPFTMELRAVGSTVTAYVDDVPVLTAVDTYIPTGRYVGIGASGSGHVFDNFEAGVLLPSDYVVWDGSLVTWGSVQAQWNSSAPDVLPPTQYYPKRWQQMFRGIGTSNEFSVEAVFKGDVQVEQVSVFFQGSILGGDDEGR